MAKIIPFHGTAYDTSVIGVVDRVVAPPYDIIDAAGQQALYNRHPQNIIRLELGLDQPGDVPAVIAFALFAFGAVNITYSFAQLEYGVGITDHKFSFKAAEFLRKNPIAGKMFNFFDIGGFLDWQLYPQALTFIDGRAISPKVFQEHQMVTSGMAGWGEVLRRYGVTYIVTKSMDSSGFVLPLVQALSADPNWSLVFADGLFVIFVRNTPENQGYIRRFGIDKSAIPRHIIQEAYHYTFLGVSPLVAYQTMSNMYMLLGDRQGAIRVLR